MSERVQSVLDPSTTKEDLLNALFFNVEQSPVAFQQPNTVWKLLKEWNVRDLKRKDVDRFYRKHAAELQYVRPRRTKFDRLWTFAMGLNHTWQADLLDWKRGAHVRYILTKIDVFSRQANARVLSDKSGPVVARALMEIIEEDGKPNFLHTDQGREFFNQHVDREMTTLGVKQYFVHSDVKASIVERFNRTLRNTLNPLFRRNPRANIKESLSDVIRAFNARTNSYHGYAPADITLHNHGAILQNVLQHRDDMAKSAPKVKYKFKVGDRVLVAYHPTQFRKEAAGTFKEEVFVISSRGTRRAQPNIPVYKLKDLLERPLDGIHYTAQLQKVDPPRGDKINPKVKRIDRRTGRKLVTYPGFPKDFEEWI